MKKQGFKAFVKVFERGELSDFESIRPLLAEDCDEVDFTDAFTKCKSVKDVQMVISTLFKLSFKILGLSLKGERECWFYLQKYYILIGVKF